MIDLLAYIDPASTALVWQILAGIFISFGVVLSIWWKQITNFFKSIWVKLFKSKRETTEVEKIDEELSDEEPLEKSDTAKVATNARGEKN